MGKRVIVGLKSAKFLSLRPKNIPFGRPRGAKGLGVRYEKALARAFGPLALPGVWIEFEDANGMGVCQVDFLLPMGENGLLILEAKLKWTPEGQKELDTLYLPVVKMASKREIFKTGVVCKNLTKDMGKVEIFNSIPELWESDKGGVFHWTGLVGLIGVVEARP